MKRNTFIFFFIVFGFASAKEYEVGNVYTYDYVLKLEMSEPSKSPSTVGYKILTQVKITPVWEGGGSSLLQLSLENPSLQVKSAEAPEPEGFRDHSSNLEKATLHPFYVHWKDGRVVSTHWTKGDDTSLVNVKKGIANLLQVKRTSASSSEEEGGTEDTPAGRCKVKYEAKDAFHLEKVITEGCEPLKDYGNWGRVRNGKALGSETNSEIRANIALSRDSGVVGEVHAKERHVVTVTIKKEVGGVVDAEQTFKLKSTGNTNPPSYSGQSVITVLREIEKSSKVQLVEDSLSPNWEKPIHCFEQSCHKTDALTKHLSLENVATTKMASSFVQLVSRIRDGKAEDLKAVLKPKSPFFLQVLDVCAASGSSEVHKAVMKALNFQHEEDIAFPERYLLGLSLSANPAPEVLQDLFKLMKRSVPSPKLQETLTLTIASIAHTTSLRSSQKSHLSQEIEDYFLNSLSSCGTPECTQLYLRSLKNLRSESTIPQLFETLLKSDQKTAATAMKSLHAMPDKYLTSNYRPNLLKIIKQLGRKWDSSVRTLALDIILRSDPTKSEIVEITSFLLTNVVDKGHAEVSTFMWNRIQEFMENNPRLRQMLEETLTEKELRTYHHLSPKGLSTAFRRSFTTNSSFSNAIEMSGKILKRSAFDVLISGGGEGVDILSLGIFADGLASFASGDDEPLTPEEEEVDATAGMELTLLGVQTRPLVFFTGKGELMGLVWSGAGSERTSAIAGNVLLQDERRVIPLFNGILAEVTIMGGLSFDLAGQVQISLWHRTANSLVENKAGLVLSSVIRADTSFVKSRVDYTLASEAALHFTSDINFYQGVLMCLKLTQPDFKVRQSIHKTERIPGSKHKLRKAIYKTTPIPGITYALNRKNSELCGIMYKDKDEL